MQSRRPNAIDSNKIEIWLADEACICLKNKITRQWCQALHPPQHAP
jgi:hypothetical protein